MMNRRCVGLFCLAMAGCPSSEKKPATPTEIPVAADFKQEVESSIDASNYKAALDALASEITPTAKAESKTADDQ